MSKQSRKKIRFEISQKHKCWGEWWHEQLARQDATRRSLLGLDGLIPINPHQSTGSLGGKPR